MNLKPLLKPFDNRLKSPFIMNPYRFAGGVAGTHGYYHNGSASNIIDRFAFATDGNATNVGDATTTKSERGASSDITGGFSYVFAGNTSTNVIERHANASSANGAGVGDLTNSNRLPSSSESSTHGYRSGGWT